MAVLLEKYRAQCVQIVLKEQETLRINYTGDIGLLLNYESQNKYPGQHFFVFYTDEGKLQTSPGSIEIDVEKNTIALKSKNHNYYKFKVLNQSITEL